MEEFKKPCLRSAPANVDIKSNKPKDNLEDNIDNAARLKPENPTQLCPYKVPQWSDRPSDDNNYWFELLKSGQIIDKIRELQKKAYWSFGRLPENDIEMAHPTISRFHAILQYRPKWKNLDNSDAGENENKDNTHEDKSPLEGWYIYDLGSTHGTFLNKQRIPPKVYIRIKVGHILRLGSSTRSYILQGPCEDEEPESELTITELKAKRRKELEEAALEKIRISDEAIESAYNEGCSWGMGEDADEESDLKHNPYATTNNEELFFDDPKKTLRGYFEREGLELVYKCDEMSAGSFVCRVELPIDDANGRPIVAEVVHKGKKKDCVLQCALEACRLLDRHGVLRQANQEPLKRKQKSQESDSDDDEFLDRTGDVARKKQRKATINANVTLTYEDLLKQEIDINEKIQQTESKINKYQEQQQRLKAKKIDEDLDAFMENLQQKEIELDKTEIRKLRHEEQRLKSEKHRVQRLIKIAKPNDLSFSSKATDIIKSEVQGQNTVKKQLPMIGKRNQFSKFKILKLDSTSTSKEFKPVCFLESNEEEMEEGKKSIGEKGKESKPCNDTGFTSESKESTEEKIKLTETKIVIENKTPKINLQNESQLNECIKAFADNNCEEIEHTSSKNVQELLEYPQNKSTYTGSSCSKKRRYRIRQRDKRQEIDDDVEYESSEKYAKWVPPENQTGDGFTELNKKFNY